MHRKSTRIQILALLVVGIFSVSSLGLMVSAGATSITAGSAGLKQSIAVGNQEALAKIDSSLRGLAVVGGPQTAKVFVVTTNPNEVYGVLSHYVDLGQLGKKEATTGKLVTLVLDVPGSSLVKVAGLSSVSFIANYELQQATPPPDEDMPVRPRPEKVEPLTWFAIETHGARAAWDKGYTGAGVNVAIIDTGVDFANPDLQGRQAREPHGPYAGWPIAFDSRSMMAYLFSSGKAFPSTDVWYSDTSSTDTTGYIVTGTSKSGVYHIGLHPDHTLAMYWYGRNVAVLVVDEHIAGVYDTVYVDLNNDANFVDEKPNFRGDEIAWRDLTGDGLADVSGGMVYFTADGIHGVPYSDVISSAYGIPNVVPAAGTLVAFMINDITENGGDHGTLCASAVAAQGVVSDGVVRGMAKDAKIISIGNFYQGGNSYDDYYFAVEGYDGIPGTGDEANEVSMSFGSSGVINDGWDFESRFLDYITTFYNPYVTFYASTGNGGHGYGTITEPGSSAGIISVGAATEYWSFEDIRDNDQILWGDVQPWSNRGPNAIGQPDPDVVAIGAWGSGDLPLNEVGDGNAAWTVWGGTSMACPIAAGVGALMYQAYIVRHGASPTSSRAREIMMSSATNLNYDPLVQGAGMVNGSRATDMASESGGIIVSPPFWVPGRFEGREYPAFTKIMFPGDESETTFKLTNTQSRTTPAKPNALEVKLSTSVLRKTGEYAITFTSERAKESPYSTGRPDYLWDITKVIPGGTNLVKVFAYFSFDKMDPDHDYTNQNNNYYRLLVYDWKDLNGNGKYWNDFNDNGVVNTGEMEPQEINRYTYGYPSGSSLECRVHDPLDRYHDGILVGIQHRYHTALAPNVPINIRVEFYTKANWDWLEVDPDAMPLVKSETPASHRYSLAQIPHGGSMRFEASLEVPEDAQLGLYEGTINLNYGTYETVIPVVVHVASRTSTFTFGGSPPADTPYDNGRVFGGFDWRWRYEAGDWRFYYADIPKKEVNPGTKLLLDLQWATTPTDIDAFIYGPQPDVFSTNWPKHYGPYTLGFKGGSADAYIGSGVFKFQTRTGGSEEVISADAVPGLNLIALHNVLYNDRSGELFSGKLGTFAINPSQVSITTNAPLGTQLISAVSSLDLSGLTAVAYGLSQPEHLTGQTIYQDDPANFMTASWRKEYTLTSAGLFDVNLRVGANDLDLYILYDKNNNGVPEASEVIAQATNPAGVDESIRITMPTDGRYWVFVHGWSVVPSPSTFDVDTTIIQGTSLTVSNLPIGAVPAGTTVTFNLNYDLSGKAAGTWQGLIFVGPTNAPTAVTIPVTIVYGP